MEHVYTPKKKPSDLLGRTLSTPPMTDEDWEEFLHGVNLFNEGKFWHAHEAWEEVWRRHTEDERLFFQGLIQLAAAYHHLTLKKSHGGCVNNLQKSADILNVFRPEFMGVAIEPLMTAIADGKKEAEALGPEQIDEFRKSLIVKIAFQRPPDPDLRVGIRELLLSEQFLEGVRMFNNREFWEAHEMWDQLRQNYDGETKLFAEGFTQMASAYHFVMMRKFTNAVYLFDKAVERLKTFAQQTDEYPLSRIIECMSQSRQAIAEGGADVRRDACMPVIPVPLKQAAVR